MIPSEQAREKSGRCSSCGRHYSDRLFNIDEYIKQNMTGIEYLARKRDEPVTAVIERDRAKFATYLAQRGYDNCTRHGCKMAIKTIETDDAAG
jgi:hypothetical protein